MAIRPYRRRYFSNKAENRAEIRGIRNRDSLAALFRWTVLSSKTRYNREADTFGGHAWDALSILVKALQKAGDNRAGLRDEIEKTAKFAGIGGIFSYSATNHDGLTNDAFVMVQIKNGNWTLLKKK